MTTNIQPGDFEVGDKVRVTNKSFVYDRRGKTGEVVRAGDFSASVRFNNGDQVTFNYRDSLEKINPDKPKGDPVNHPPHYTAGKYEVLDVIEDWGLTKHSHLANVIKYVARHDKKGSRIENLEKARTYLDREINNAKEGVFQ